MNYKGFSRIVEFAIQKDIKNLRLFKGYKNDYVLHIQSTNSKDFELISNIARKDFDVNVVQNKNLYITERESENSEFLKSLNQSEINSKNKLPFIEFN